MAAGRIIIVPAAGIMSRYLIKLVVFSLAVLLGGWSVLAQSQPGADSGAPSAAEPSTTDGAGQPDGHSAGSVSGTIVDQTGAAVAGAGLKLTFDNSSSNQVAVSSDDGRFSFASVAPGPFHLTITSAGFATQSFSGVVHSGEAFSVPRIQLAIAASFGEVKVVPSHVEVAQDEIKAEEQQRALGFIPNFYVSYIPDAVSLTSKQKFGLAWKTVIDPVSFGLNAVTAGIQQANNDFSGYGQGAEGYAKRYGASYADFVTSTYIGSAILPSILKQDPRYFYKGTGSIRSRALYAMANAVICKGDNGKWQANYSSMLGNLASAGISNLYYPSKNDGARLTFENALIDLGTVAAANLLQEFLIKKLTPNLPHHSATDKPQSTISKLFSSIDREGD
jgi:hypothetical protein